MTGMITASVICSLALAAEAPPGVRADIHLLRAGTSPAAGARQQIGVRVWPPLAQAPAAVRIDVDVEPHEENRTLLIVVDSGEFRSSSIALDGAHAARVNAVRYDSLPAGAYQVIVQLRTQEGLLRAAERQDFNITP